MHQKKNKGLKIFNMSINPCFSLLTRYAQTFDSLHFSALMPRRQKMHTYFTLTRF